MIARIKLFSIQLHPTYLSIVMCMDGQFISDAGKSCSREAGYGDVRGPEL